MTFNSLHDPAHIYFITASICGWKQICTEPVYASIILGSMKWLRKKERMKLYAYVLMPNHLHAVIKPVGATIGALLRDFGSFTAHQILKQLREEERFDLLEFFQEQK
jgi:putative transposase